MTPGASVKPPTLAPGRPQRVRQRGEGASGRPIVIDLFCGLGGWSDGFLAEGYQCIGFDLERHDYSRVCPMCEGTGICDGIPDCIVCDRTGRIGSGGYPGELVLQDVTTIHGRQFRDAACIVASPPCQEFSYMAMPWKRGKQIRAALRGDRDPTGLSIPFPEGYTGSRTIAQLKALFDACFRIQREASEAAGHHIPMVVENVKGAQPWVGRANAAYGSFFLWGDVRSVGGRIVAAHRVEFGALVVKACRAGAKVPGMSWSGSDKPGYKPLAFNGEAERRIREGQKVPMNFHEHAKTGKPGRSFQTAAVESLIEADSGTKQAGLSGRCANGNGTAWFEQGIAHLSSRSSARKAASAQIAKIPFALSEYIARSFRPEENE